MEKQNKTITIRFSHDTDMVKLRQRLSKIAKKYKSKNRNQMLANTILNLK